MVNHNNFFMSVEVDPEIQGVLIKNQSIILEPNRQQELEQKGYGDMVKDKLVLKPFESLYLLYTDKLALFRGKKNIGFDLFLQICKKQDESILTKFLVYRDLRTRGYTVKDGFGFGSDFRVYAKGDFGEKGAKFLVFGLNEGKQEKIGKLQKKVEEITKMGKEPIIAVIQRQMCSTKFANRIVTIAIKYPVIKFLCRFNGQFRLYFYRIRLV